MSATEPAPTDATAPKRPKRASIFDLARDHVQVTVAAGLKATQVIAGPERAGIEERRGFGDLAQVDARRQDIGGVEGVVGVPGETVGLIIPIAAEDLAREIALEFSEGAPGGPMGSKSDGGGSSSSGAWTAADCQPQTLVCIGSDLENRVAQCTLLVLEAPPLVSRSR